MKKINTPIAEMTIAGLARTASVNVETIRFYQQKGLMLLPPKPLGGYRHYGFADVARLRFIKAAKQIGFTLEEIAQLLKLDDGTHCDQAREIAELKLIDVKNRIANLKRIATTLTKHIKHCSASHGDVSCPLIDSLQEAI